MPNIVMGQNKASVDVLDFKDVKTMAQNNPYKYDYKEVVGIKDFRPGTKVHDAVKDAILVRARASRSVMESRFESWRQIDRTLTSYVHADEDEIKVQKKDSRKPVSVVIPVSFAILDTIMTYYNAAFPGDPFFRYSGTGPEDIIGAMKMQAAVGYQCRRSKVGLDLYAGWRAGAAYGIGYYYIGHKSIQGLRTRSTEGTVLSKMREVMVKSGIMKDEKVLETIYEGGTVTAIDPYKALPDPDISVHKVQEMGYFGWVERTNLFNLLKEESANDEDFVNVKYLKHMHATSIFNDEKSTTGRSDKFGKVRDDGTSGVTKPVDIIPMFIEIIPSDWSLGDSDDPEMYFFVLAGDQVIIRAQPMGLDHNMMPIAANAPDFDGFGTTPIGRIETIYGLQHTLDWMYKSHMTNVRKAINDMLVVDPQLINIHDLKSPEPGKLIRMRRGAWGRGVKDAIMQLNVNDITTNNVQDTALLRDWAHSISGAQDIVQGIRRGAGERISATEASDTMKAALSRLEKMAKLTSVMAHEDIAYQMAWNTRQLMEQETWLKIQGDWDKDVEADMGVMDGRLLVTPKDVDVDFDVESHDGTVPGSGDAGMWLQLYQIVAGNEVLAQNIDMVKMFKFGARLAGAKNINDFVKGGGNVQPTVVPDAEVEGQVQQGNLRPATVQ